MSSDTRTIYEEYIRALSRGEQRLQFNVLQDELGIDSEYEFYVTNSMPEHRSVVLDLTLT